MKKAAFLCCFLATSVLTCGVAAAQEEEVADAVADTEEVADAGAVSREPDLFIAGVKPWLRPDTAPRPVEYVKNDQWYVDALTGVSQPYPRSLYFLEDQGGWFNPFTMPGMTGPYDIRGRH
ncbi:MAG: hypothetical protein CSA74_00490 [Rhodobacterales bacterium]|nr:MAG: hypothetical protein CSA74_00490 [Rhodobacterales bacterium]